MADLDAAFHEQLLDVAVAQVPWRAYTMRAAS